APDRRLAGAAAGQGVLPDRLGPAPVRLHRVAQRARDRGVGLARPDPARGAGAARPAGAPRGAAREPARLRPRANERRPGAGGPGDPRPHTNSLHTGLNGGPRTVEPGLPGRAIPSLGGRTFTQSVDAGRPFSRARWLSRAR